MARPHLCDRLEQPGRALRVVVGAAGSGKSSLLAEWVRRRPAGRWCWLNADGADRDPVRFWQGVIEAIRTAVPGFAEEAFDLLTLDGVVAPDALESLLASAECLDHAVTLVVDDFHLVAPSVHEDLRFLGRRGLGTVELALGTRVDLAIGLDRLRLDGELCELRDHDLSLSSSESLELFEKLSPGTGVDQVAVLAERTEGWVAGMVLAAVAIDGASEPEHFVRRFAGTSQVVARYLTAEVLDAQTPEIRRFLLDTCVVDELSPGLAASLSPGTPVTLDDLEAAHLMIVRLDRDGSAFRYHHLFGEVLRHRLATTEPRHEQVLHDRAADWFATVGDLSSAFRHRWLAGRSADAMSLIHGSVVSEFLAGHVPEVSKAGLSLRDADILAAPGPSVSYCGAVCFEGRPQVAEQLVERVGALVGDDLDPADRMQLLATRAAIAAMVCDTTATVAHGWAVIDLAAAEGLEGDWLNAAVAFLVRAHAWRGEFAEGERAAAGLALTGPNPSASIEVRGAVAFLRSEEGRLREAEELAAPALTTARPAEEGLSTVAAPPGAVLGSVLLERGRVREAESQLLDVSGLATHVRAPMMVLACIGLSRIWAAEGNIEAASQILQGGQPLVSAPLEVSGPAIHLRLAEGRLAVSLGDVERAAELVGSVPPGFGPALLTARIRTASGRTDLARRLLDELEPHATGTRRRLALELGRLEAAIADEEDVAEHAAAVLDLAAPEGFLFAIGEAGVDVLGAACDVARRRPRTAFVDDLLRYRPHVVPSNVAAARYRSEALSERERTVLRYLATSMSNREIAADLYVSVNTVKTHVKNIFRKLDAETRDQALGRAREQRYL